MDSLLKRLDAVLDAQFLGAAWFETPTTETDIQTKVNELCSIKNQIQPKLKDLLSGCKVFFGSEFDNYVEQNTDYIKLKRIPIGIDALEIYLRPFRSFEVAPGYDQDYSAEMIIMSNDQHKKKKHLKFNSTHEMITILCEQLISDVTMKKYILDITTRAFSNEDKAQRVARIKATKKKQETNKTNQMSRQAVISILTGEQNESFRAWLSQVKLWTHEDRTDPTKLVEELLAVVKQKINEGT
jgi:hypothetical protein